MRGFFHLQSPQDLLHKLERDYTALQQSPADVDIAFNFFVTAEHLPDWLARTGPQFLKGQRINAFKKAHPLTRICAHLANGGKHLQPRSEHDSVAATGHNGVFDAGVFEPGVVEEWLTVDLTPRERQLLGQDTLDVRTLAGQVLAFWQDHCREVSAP